MKRVWLERKDKLVSKETCEAIYDTLLDNVRNVEVTKYESIARSTFTNLERKKNIEHTTISIKTMGSKLTLSKRRMKLCHKNVQQGVNKRSDTF